MEYEFLLITAKLVNGTNFSEVVLLPEFLKKKTFSTYITKPKFSENIVNGVSLTQFHRSTCT